MKAIILQYMSELIESSDAEEKTRLSIKLSESINKANLDLDTEKQVHVKKLIIATINNYADTGDASLKSALEEHYKTLDTLLFNYS